MQGVLKIRTFQLVLAVFITSSTCVGSPVVLFGKDSNYAGDSLVFYVHHNPIINLKYTLDTCFFDEDGRFKMEFDLDQTQAIYVEDGVNQMYFFAEPGATYELVLPPRSEKTIEDMLNPYFQFRQIHLGIKNTCENELNSLIQAFDMLFNPFFNMYARQVYANIKLENIDDFEFKMDSVFGSVRHHYFNQYKKFRLLLLDYMRFSGESVQKAYERFPYEDMNMNNPAAVELFSQVFNRFIYKISENQICNSDGFTMNETGLISLQKCVLNSGLFLDEEFSYLLILKGLYDELYYEEFDRRQILNMIGILTEHDTFPTIRSIAKDLYEDITRLDPGQPAPDFRLERTDGNVRTLHDYLGSYIYLGFVSTKSYASLMQFPVLAELARTFGDTLDIVTIVIEDTREDLLAALEGKSYPWDFLYFDHQAELLENYRIRAYPGFYLIDPQGFLLWSPAVSPVEGFEKKFQDLIKTED